MNQRKLGSVISYLQMILTLVVSIIYTPYMIQKLGQNEYGLYNTVASTISMLSILSLGFNSGYIKYYSVYKKKGDTESIQRLNGLFLEIFLGIGLIALICGLYLAFHLDLVFRDGLTSDEYALAKILMIILTGNLAISFPMSVFSNIISAHERFVVLKLIGIMKTVCGPLVTIPLLFCGYRSIAIVSVTVAFSLVADLIYVWYVLLVLKEHFLWLIRDKKLITELTVYTSFIAINMVIDQINWNIDKLLLARYKGTASAAIYSVGYTLNTYYNMVSTAVSGVFTPLVHGIVNEYKEESEKQREELTKVFIKVGRVQFLILGLFGTGLVLFGKPFILRWAGEGYGEAYYVVLLLALPATIPLIQNVGIEIQRAMNKHRFRSIAYLIMALLNLMVSIILCQIYGPIGCAFGTGASMILANGFLMNLYYHKQCNIDVLRFWKEIVRILPGIMIPFLCFALLTYWIGVSNSYKVLIPWIFGYSSVYVICVWILSMNSYEKELILRFARKAK